MKTNYIFYHLPPGTRHSRYNKTHVPNPNKIKVPITMPTATAHTRGSKFSVPSNRCRANSEINFH